MFAVVVRFMPKRQIRLIVVQFLSHFHPPAIIFTCCSSSTCSFDVVVVIFRVHASPVVVNGLCLHLRLSLVQLCTFVGSRYFCL